MNTTCSALCKVSLSKQLTKGRAGIWKVLPDSSFLVKTESMSCCPWPPPGVLILQFFLGIYFCLFPFKARMIVWNAQNSFFVSFRQRLPPKNVYYYRCPDHRKNYVMSFAFCFDLEEDIYQFAYCYPYTYTRFQHYLDSLQKRNMDYFFREQLGQSVVRPIQGQAAVGRACNGFS